MGLIKIVYSQNVNNAEHLNGWRCKVFLSYSMPIVKLLVKKNLTLVNQEATRKMNTLGSMNKFLVMAIAKENNISIEAKSKTQLIVELLQLWGMVK